MARDKKLQTTIPGFGRIYQPTYRDKKTRELKHSGIWWVEYQTKDGPVWRSTKQRDQQAAYNELLRLAGRKACGEITDSAPERVTFARLFELLEADYEERKLATLVDIGERIRVHIGPAFGDIRVIDLRKADVETFKRSMLAEDYAPATINRCLSAVRRALQLGADEDPPLVIRAIPRWLGKLDESEGVRTGVITPEMYRALLPASVAPHARLAFVIGYHTGLRRGAILSLRWEWVDWKNFVIRIPPAKKSTKMKPRFVPIYGDMRGFIEMARASNPPGCP